MPIWVRQAAAIPILNGKIGMVSSRSGRRWVVPKGQIEPCHSPRETALNEAWEEAGLVGVLEDQPAGTYCYEKMGRDYHVLVYRMNVTEVRVQWPERSVRDRIWVSLDDALDRIEEPVLREILRVVYEASGRDDWSLTADFSAV